MNKLLLTQGITKAIDQASNQEINETNSRKDIQGVNS
jgi:hypothetical protein